MNINIDLIGVSNGDTIIWNSSTQKFGQIKIPFYDHDNLNLPNFIIALSGQSNSQGYETLYDPNNPNDQPNSRIFGWNPNLQEWQIADLRTESLGWSYITFKQLGTQCSAFHLAKRLIEAYPNIRPGIINVGVSGASIAFWTNWQSTDIEYDLTMKKIKWYQGKDTFPFINVPPQGYIFNVHIEQINSALKKIPPICQNINILLWDQGESDSELDYLKSSLYHVINRYISTLTNLGYYNNKLFGFISVSTTGLLYLNNNIKVNDVLQILNEDSNPYTKFISATDLPVAILAGTTNTIDPYHFNSEAQRIIGTRAFHAYRSMFSSKYDM
jgi:hypothetical protein